jgi:hypothetical protein
VVWSGLVWPAGEIRPQIESCARSNEASDGMRHARICYNGRCLSPFATGATLREFLELEVIRDSLADEPARADRKTLSISSGSPARVESGQNGSACMYVHTYLHTYIPYPENSSDGSEGDVKELNYVRQSLERVNANHYLG